MIEIRNHNDNICFRNEGENRHVEGYAVLFNSQSNLINGEFYEVIERGALDGLIERSDVLCLLNHNQDKGVLARSNKGVGSMVLTIDERGLKYSFECPKMSLGEELMEGLRRGDISSSSFAFTVKEQRYEQRSDGQVIRHIDAIDQLFDVSPVYCAAYPETTVDLRGYNEFMEQLKKQQETRSEEEKEDKEIKSTEEDKETKNACSEEPEKEEKSAEEDNEKETSEESEEDNKEENSEEEEENKEEDKEEERKNESSNLYLKKDNNIKTMAKFSILKCINDVVNKRAFDEATLNLIKEGRSIADKSGISANGQIVLPTELRAEGDAPATATKPINGLMATEATIGAEVVPTDLWNIQGALRDRMVLAQAGAQFISATSNIDIPTYDGSSVFWESEIGQAKDGSSKFSKVTLKPQRLTAFVPISKQLIIQSSESVENMIREDLISAVAEKLQQTILGNGAGQDGVEPRGIFNGVTADTAAFTFEDAVNMEAALESANVYGDFSYICSPDVKAKLRCLPVDKGSGKFVMEHNEVLGIPAYSTNSVVQGGLVLGDFKNLIVCQFGALDIVVDEITLAARGQIQLIVNFYVDYAVKRPSAVVKRILK